MKSKKEEFLLMLKFCTFLFAIIMIAAFVYSVCTQREFIRTEFMGQVLIITGAVFLGGLLGLTNVILPIRSSKLKISVIGGVFYGISLWALSSVPLNPLGNAAVFFAYTFLFAAGVFLVATVFGILQKRESEKIMRQLRAFQEGQTNNQT